MDLLESGKLAKKFIYFLDKFYKLSPYDNLWDTLTHKNTDPTYFNISSAKNSGSISKCSKYTYV